MTMAWKAARSRSLLLRIIEEETFRETPHRKKKDARSLLAVTIKQLDDAKFRDLKFYIDEKEHSQVTLVGQIRKVEVQETKIIYVIEDGTGNMQTHMYIDMEEDMSKRSSLREGVYVRVIGNLRILSGVRCLVAFQLIPVTDYNEMTFHMLEVIHSYLLHTQGPLPQSAASSQSTSSSSSSSSSRGSNGGMEGETADSNFSELQRAVLKVFQEDDAETGMSVQAVCQRIRNRSEQDIRNTIAFFK